MKVKFRQMAFEGTTEELRQLMGMSQRGELNFDPIVDGQIQHDTQVEQEVIQTQSDVELQDNSQDGQVKKRRKRR